MNDKSMIVSVEVYRAVMEELKNGRKIHAIKKVRNASGCGLKEAKQAVDRLFYEKVNPSGRGPSVSGRQIVAQPNIVKITLDYGEGPIELDLEGMQLRALTQLPTIGLEACAHMLELVEVFKALQEGKTIKIVDEDAEEISAE